MAAAFRTDVERSDMDEALWRISWSEDAAADDDGDPDDDRDDDEEEDGVRNDMDEALGLTGSAAGGGGGGGPGGGRVGDPIPLRSNRLSTASAFDDMAAASADCF